MVSRIAILRSFCKSKIVAASCHKLTKTENKEGEKREVIRRGSFSKSEIIEKRSRRERRLVFSFSDISYRKSKRFE